MVSRFRSGHSIRMRRSRNLGVIPDELNAVSQSIQRVEADVVVVGSGAGGLSAAVSAALLGLRVLVVEKAQVFGGCLAFSAGIPWIPANDQMAKAGMQDSPAAGMRYLRAVVGDSLREDLATAYLDAAPRMLSFFEA